VDVSKALANTQGTSWRRTHLPVKRMPMLVRPDAQPRKAAASSPSKKFEVGVACPAELLSSPMRKALWEDQSSATQTKNHWWAQVHAAQVVAQRMVLHAPSPLSIRESPTSTAPLSATTRTGATLTMESGETATASAKEEFPAASKLM